jgi:hypothetical protein
MDIYNLTAVESLTGDPCGMPLYGFKITGVLGSSLATLAFDSREQAGTVRQAMEPIITKAIVIGPNPH